MESASSAKTFAKLILVLFLVPLAAWVLTARADHAAASEYMLEIAAGQYRAHGMSYQKMCADHTADMLPGHDRICGLAENISTTRPLILIVCLTGILLLGLILGARAWAGTNRSRMAHVFGPATRAAMLILSLSAIAQAGLLLLIFFRFGSGSEAGQGRGFLIVLAVAVGAFIGSLQLVRIALQGFRSQPLRARGVTLEPERHPHLFALVRGVAEKLGAAAPDQIIAGLEPNFFVTTGDVFLLSADKGSIHQSGALAGRSLYVSLPLMRLFSKEEFAAVVGHELGHFRGLDIEYSMKFAPTYARLTQSLRAVGATGNFWSSLGRLPAYVTLAAILTEFAALERKVRRERELLADQAGIEASSPDSLARALVKVSLFSGVWAQTRHVSLKEIGEGTTTPNLSLRYVRDCEAARQTVNWMEARTVLAANVQAHPIDTHPSLGQRMEAVGVSLDEIGPEDLKAPNDSSLDLVQEPASIEESLSVAEEKFWRAVLPSHELKTMPGGVSTNGAPKPAELVHGRAQFEEAAKRLKREAKRAKGTLCLVLVEVRGVRRFDDRYGEGEREKLRSSICPRIAECVTMAARAGDVVVLLEFNKVAALLPDTSPLEARRLAEDVIMRVVQAFESEPLHRFVQLRSEATAQTESGLVVDASVDRV